MPIIFRVSSTYMIFHLSTSLTVIASLELRIMCIVHEDKVDLEGAGNDRIMKTKTLREQ
jgi:hypothetical protein